MQPGLEDVIDDSKESHKKQDTFNYTENDNLSWIPFQGHRFCETEKEFHHLYYILPNIF
jgi:hypothetical protein